VDEVVHAPCTQQVVVEVELERDGDAVRGSDRPALLALTLDEHLIAGQVVPGDANAAVGKLLEVPFL
jgi:hypothetical protein